MARREDAGGGWSRIILPFQMEAFCAKLGAFGSTQIPSFMEGKMGKGTILFAISFVSLVSVSPALSQPITTGTLIEEMIDLHRLAEFPSPAYKTIQFSSYDHRSSLPGGPDWFANSDGFGGEPIPNFEAVLVEPGEDGIGEYLICDVRGPGAIVRVWTALIKGTIRLTVDDTETPVYEGPAQEFLLRPWDSYIERAGLRKSVFDGTFAQRNAGYYPIPFAERCRIVWIGNVKEIHFYQIQIRVYEPGTDIQTFSPGDLKQYRDEIQQAAGVLSDPDGNWEFQSSRSPEPIAARITERQSQIVFESEGAGAIECLSLRLRARDLDKALRQSILHVSFDGYPWGQIQSPVGDFFGAAPGINPFNSVPFTVRPDGTMVCRYYMPFEKHVRIQIDNRGEQPVTVTGSVLLSDYDWKPERSMHFRARWRVDHDMVASNQAVQDMPYLVADGKGVYVGTSTILLNPNNVPSSGGNWWGEGDEKIFVDDDQVPSTFGTGSEDYYNYAWSSSDIFLFPYCGQPRNDGPANRGFVTNNRWHILDPLPFKDRINFYMELFSHERTPGVSYARISYHYGCPGLRDDHLPITDEDVRYLELPEDWEPAARGAARDSVFYQAEELVEGDPDYGLRKGRLWARGELFVWNPERRGNELILTIPVQEDGDYVIHITAALTCDSGKFSARLDGQRLHFNGKDETSLFVPHRTLLRNFGSEKRHLTKGKHELLLKHEGVAEDDTQGSIGLDFLWVQKR